MRATFLEYMAKKHEWKRGAEIGLWYGKTFFHLLDAIRDLVLYGVDTWQESELFNKHKSAAENKKTVILRAFHYDERATILSMPSLEAAQQFPDNDLDFVFIDADHSFDAVCADIQAWLPKVKAGGYLTGHDWDWESVRSAVLKLLPDATPGDESNDFVWYWRKPA